MRTIAKYIVMTILFVFASVSVILAGIVTFFASPFLKKIESEVKNDVE